ncbi:MAG: histidine phosphatase family protein [Candidatus Binatia bacterium]|nr:histidine phosphatase family protein [Candidatus Binatia bacterium]
MAVSKVITLVLLRHGETVAGSSTRYWGATDVALSEFGREQMRRAAPFVAQLGVGQVFTSCLSRTRDAAAIVAPQVPAIALKELNEVNFGRWEGLTREQIATAYPEEYARWQRRDQNFRYPGGESLVEFQRRIELALNRILDSAAPTTLVVAHRGVIARLLAQLLHWDTTHMATLHIPLGSLHLLRRVADHVWKPERLDYTAHLDALRPVAAEEEAQPTTRN